MKEEYLIIRPQRLNWASSLFGDIEADHLLYSISSVRTRVYRRRTRVW